MLFAISASIFGQVPKLLIPLPVAILAAVTSAIGLAAYVWLPKVHAYAFSLIPFASLSITVGTLCGLTGGIDSPYLPLWMLVTVFSGIFGYYGLGMFGLVVVISTIHRIWFDLDGLQREEIFMSLLAGGIPLITSYLIWHERGKQETRKQVTLDTLTQQLSQVANKSDIVINSIADGVLAIDEGGIIQVINPAAQSILGWSRDDALQLDYHSVFRLSDSKGNDIPDSANPIQQVLYNNELKVNNNLSLSTKSGKLIAVSLLVSPVPVGDSKAAGGAIAVFRDITDEKHQERAQAEFISTASHEMRTPVAAIEGYLSLALNPATASIDDKAKTYLQKAHESTEHLGRLFQDLLTVSRAEDGRLLPKPVVVDIMSFVREIVDGLSAKAQAKGLTLQFLPSGGGADQGTHTIAPAYYSYLDRDHLREVLSNLIDNAIKYSKQGGVGVDITSTDDNITISITDTGIGIPPEDLPHLFQKFYRVDESYTREVGGTGLGLYICRRLIENNNGKVWAESTYGQGSSFFVQIPRITHEKAAALKETGQPSIPAATQPSVASAAASITQPPTPTAAAPQMPVQPPAPAVTAPITAAPSSPVTTTATAAPQT